jgi:hypothetical protein
VVCYGVGGSGSGETRRLECGGVSGGCEVSSDSVKKVSIPYFNLEMW